MVIQILQNLLKYPTITPHEHGIYNYIQTLLPDFEAIFLEKEGVKNLFLYKIPKGYDSGAFEVLPHFCFAGHIDVVPPGGNAEIPQFSSNTNTTHHKASKGEWEYPPFESIVHDGYIYGRGTQDMKGGIACFIQALKDFLTTTQAHIIFSVLLTSDEEGPGIYGTKYMLEFLKEKKMLPIYAIVAEPTSQNIAGDTIKNGRRGSINGVITICGKQGHVAYPSKCINPVELLGERLGKIAGYNLDLGDEYFEESKIVVTDIRGGIQAVNVTPNDLTIMFNVRNSTITTLDDIKTYLDSILYDLPYTLTLTQSSQSFLTKDSVLIDILQNSILKEINIMPKLSTSGGTSDARFFSEYGVEVVEVGVCNDRIHAINERVAINDIHTLYKIFIRFLEYFHTAQNKA